MINANEIRLGNIYEHNANWCHRSPAEIKPFTFKWEERDWYAVGECLMFLDDCEPIPLTPELLEECGFEKEEKYRNDGSSYFVFTLFPLTYNSIHGWWIRGMQSEFQIKYLHQLQNLYYALTNEELKIAPIK